MKPQIGKILKANRTYNRDAIHVPIMEVIASEPLSPGDKVEVVKAGDKFYALKSQMWAGVVDPYIEGEIAVGDKIYVFIKPNTVRTLWHEWTHNLVD